MVSIGADDIIDESMVEASDICEDIADESIIEDSIGAEDIIEESIGIEDIDGSIIDEDDASWARAPVVARIAAKAVVAKSWRII